MNRIFENIGGTLQGLAKVDFVLGILCVIVCIIVEIAEDTGGIVIGSGIVAGGVLIGRSYFIYAFGQMTNDLHKMSNTVTDAKPQDDEIPEI